MLFKVKDCFNIWRYSSYYPKIKEENKLTLEEGWTKETEIKKITHNLNLKNLYFKREDLNPTGSHKDRGVAYQVSKALEDNQKELVVPSSGNSAISAAAYCNLANIKLTAFVSKTISKQKLEQLRRFKPKIIFSKNIIEDAEKYSIKNNIRNLRPSREKYAFYGFKSIGFEIYEKLGRVGSIFMPVSSAASLVGIGKANIELKRLRLIEKLPELHAVQTEVIAPIAGKFCKFKQKKESIAEGIIAKTTARKKESINLIKRSNGFGWVVSDKEILDALAILNKNGIDTSPEGGAAFGAIIKAAKKRNLGRVVCLLTGHALKW